MRFDSRFSDPKAGPTPWPEVVKVLEDAELYWLTTVRADGRPHVTPLIGVRHEGAMHFTTGLDEQKARNLQANPNVVLTTGNNAWAEGLDVVVEGVATRVTGREALAPLAAAIEAKYAGAWRFEPGDEHFTHLDGGQAAVFRIEATKTFAFAKAPHGQTRY
jgi:nitroimidazol reductase NimA-like FMN-containing flavoprotein (pyridoxamine 5'-phosphate oxidase superfamily)